MITNTTAKMTYTFTEGVTEYAVGFVYDTNPDGTPQLKVYKNKLINTPLVYGTDYTMSLDGTNVVISSGVDVGETLTIIRDIPPVQLSDYVVGRIDPEQIERDMDLAVMRDQQMLAEVDAAISIPADHEERIEAIEDVIPSTATDENKLATLADIPTVPVSSVNSKTGDVVLTASDVGALPDSTTIPDAQIQSDWNQSDNTKLDYIKNKPSIPAAQVNSDWNAASGVAQILNKPTIPTVNDSTITITQGGVTKGTFTTNQSSAGTIALDAGGGSDLEADIDAKVVGSLARNGTVFSGFASDKYLELPGVFDFSKPFVFVLCGAKFDDDTQGTQTLATGPFLAEYSPTGTLTITADLSDGAPALSLQANVSPNVDYVFKITWTGSAYVFWVSTNNGATYSQAGSSVLRSGAISNGVIYLGKTATTSDFAGSINIALSSFNVWRPYSSASTKQDGIWAGVSATGLAQRVPVGHEVIAFQAPTAGNNYTWYRKYADGWIEQGGYATASGNAGAQITLPVTMSDAHYQIMLTNNDDSTGGGYHTMIYTNQATTGFDASPTYQGVWQTGAFYWEVKGMVAN